LEVRRDALRGALKEQTIIKQIAAYPFSGSVYLVGGAIREILLDRSPEDYDLALTRQEDLTRLEALFKRPCFMLGRKPIRTYRIMADSACFDVTVVEGAIEDDLRRRDFTMNAIAYDIGNDLVIDAVGGIADIKKRVIRYPQRESIASDPLRMLKAIRHFSTLKDFTLDGELLRSIAQSKQLILRVAAERIKYEMDRIIVAPNVAQGIKTLDETGLLFEIVPELFALRELDVEKGFLLETLGHTLDGFRFLHHLNMEVGLDDLMLRNVGYAFLFHDLGKAQTFSYDENKGAVHFFHHERFSQEIAGRIMERLRFSLHEMRAVLALIQSHMRIFLISNDQTTEKAIRRLIYKMKDMTPALIVHTLCDMYGSSGGADNDSTEAVRRCSKEILHAYDESLKAPLPRLISGDDLISLGFAQGPLVGRCLNEVWERQIGGEIVDRDAALVYAKTFLSETGS